MKKRELVKLNLGCGGNKIEGCVNIDIEKSCKPDLCIDFINDRLPFKTNSVDEIYLFHTIEHIPKRHHDRIFNECFRVLKLDHKIYISYPEFWKCAVNWKKNYRGMREFWEKTIYGRQAYPSDFHVALMDPHELKIHLTMCGFYHIQHTIEPEEIYNTVTVAKKGTKRYITYEEAVAADKVIIKKVS